MAAVQIGTSGWIAAEALDALRRGEQADEAQIPRAALLQALHGGDSRIGGGQHRIEHQDHAVGDVGGRLEIILHRLERFRIAIEADMGDAGGGEEVQHPVEEADARAQDRREDELLARDLRSHHRGERSFDLHHLDGDVPGHLVAEQHADLVEELAKPFRRARLVAHQRQLVLDERVVDDGDALHAVSLGAGCRVLVHEPKKPSRR